MTRRTLFAVAALLTVAACTTPEVADPTITTVSPPTSPPSSAATTTTTEATTTTTGTEALLDRPSVSGGWSLRSGDLLLSNRDGIAVVRDGAAVSQPVRSPVEVALYDGFGGIVFTTPRPELFPDHWPMRGVGGGYVIWRLNADGSFEQLHEAEGAEWEVGGIDLVRVDVMSPLGGVPSLLFTQTELIVPDDPDQHAWERMWVLPLGSPVAETAAVMLPVDSPSWEGGFSGMGWQDPPGRLLVSLGAEGLNWFSAFAADGSPLAWAMNPVPEGKQCPGEPGFSHCWWGLTTIPTTLLIAYLETDTWQTMIDLVIYDTAAGVELSRLALPADELTNVEMIHASATQIAVSRLTYESNSFRHLPVLLIDIDTGSIEELTVRGIATIVP